ncbi:MAG: redoxin domain-containing protein [Parachlamydiales bacterium]|jgi:peroxiredoxin (alkyl hydroperoxide reductase subunit C)
MRFFKAGLICLICTVALEAAETKFISIPSVGSQAPAFQVESTQGQLLFPENYRGRWAVLFSFPNVFMPVCRSELKAFLKNLDRINAAVIGISANSREQHLSFMESVKKEAKVKTAFPIISDPKKKILQLYGMLHPLENKDKPLRAVYLIDPQGLVRAIFFYPNFNGRSLKEILRLLEALQLSCREGLVTPEGWQKGARAISCPQCSSGQKCPAP